MHGVRSKSPGGATGGMTRPARTYDRYREAFAGRSCPLGYVDLDALEANLATTRDRAGSTPVRVASKSVRCRAVLRRLLDADGIEGVMCYTGDEAAFLAEHGFDDLLVAYPVVDRDELDRVAESAADGTTVALMVDSRDHVERAARAARGAGTELPLCLDLDCSTEHLGVYFGVRRSDVRTPADARALGRVVADADGVHLDGVMGYEAQIAGLPDRNPDESRLRNAVIRVLKERSRPRVRQRRTAVVAALRDAGHDLRFVNGGGTGSVESTVADPSVTEATVGSGFYAPRLFDGYDAFDYEPAAGYAVEVTREPTDDIYTCRGGGYPASGPPGPTTEPRPYLPAGAELLDDEGAGEVQTPVRYDGDLSPGDPVCFRHAKAGELCERVTELHLVRGDEVVETVPTYRGDGRWFL